MIHELHEMLQNAAARLRQLRVMRMLAVCWLVWAAAGGIAIWTSSEYGRQWPWAWAVHVGGAALSGIVCLAFSSRSARDPRWVAHRIESHHPELGAMLLAALEQAPTPRFRRLGYLQSSVIRGAVDHGRRHNWSEVAPIGRLRLAQATQFIALGILAWTCMLLIEKRGAEARLESPGAGQAPVIADVDLGLEVLPGNTEIERGATLLVIAKFAGEAPADSMLMIEGAAPEAPAEQSDATDVTAAWDTRPMSRSLDDPQFIARVPAVESDLRYYVEFEGRRSPTYQVKVFEYPTLERADARLEFPQYTSRQPTVVEDTRIITAVEGTQLTLTCRLNKPVASAVLIDRDGEELALTQSEDSESVYVLRHTLDKSRRFKLHLEDEEGRSNKLPPDIVLNVTPNEPARIKLARPAADVRVSPLEELQVAAQVTDDFGLAQYGLAYSIGGAPPEELALNDPSEDAAAKQQELAHLLDFESFKAEPDQLLSYYVWAEDIGPNGQPRRTMSDMYFAEVPPFEEIFREGEQQTQEQQRQQQQQQEQGEGGGASEQAQELAELQKQIINASWTLVRRGVSGAVDERFAEDAQMLQESQQQAIEQLAQLGEEVTDQESGHFVEQAQQHMSSAAQQLATAAGDSDLDALRGALSAEQAAYQALLKLRAREFDVTQSNSQQSGQASGGAAGGASQRQLNQLELSADENRYETESRASSAQQEGGAEQNEAREMLDRLSDMARRQEDLNERLRELQSSLEAELEEQEREAIERELKRLREQQREMLRDADELASDMQSSPNRQDMQQPKEQLDEARSHIQQITEALDQNQLSEAVNEGTRAGRELDELRDDFRKRAADRFTDEMQDLRSAARGLDERQQELSQSMTELDAQEGRTLRDTGAREELARGLDRQREELSEMLDQMEEIVQQAEEAEPLLARELYNTASGVSEQRVDEALDVAQQLTDAGVLREARDAMRISDKGIQELRQGVDRAAESVLGDETEALRRAEERLSALSQQLDNEISSATGGEDGERSAAEGQSQGERLRETEAERSERGSDEEQTGEDSADQESPGGSPGSRGGQQGQQGERGQRGDAGEQQAERNSQGEDQQPDGSDREAQQGQSQEGESQQDQPAEGQPGEGQPGQGQEAQGQSGQGRSGEGQPGQGGQPGQDRERGQGQGGESPPNGESQQPGDGQPDGQQGGGRGLADSLEEFFGGGGNGGGAAQGPITGDNFREWSGELRNVEEMLDDPELAAEARRILDRAEEARSEFRRFAKEPDWTKLQDMVAEPLAELRKRVANEIRNKESPDGLAPIERDAAPEEFAEQVRLYYERLGSGE